MLLRVVTINPAKLSRPEPSLSVTIGRQCEAQHEQPIAQQRLTPAHPQELFVCLSLRCLPLTHRKSEQLIASNRDTDN